MDTTSKLHDILQRNSYKVTSVREKVYCALADSSAPVSNSELIAQLKTIDKVSVYRTLALFESIGIINRIWTGFKSKVELGEAFSPHHHHFTCSSCNSVLSFKSSEIEDELAVIEKKLKIVIEQHHIELSGQCTQCKNQEIGSILH